MTAGQPNFSTQLNATLNQVYANGSVVQTPCYLNTKTTPPTATNLTPVNDENFAGAEIDRYITINGDTTNTQYRSYRVIGDVQPIIEG